MLGQCIDCVQRYQKRRTLILSRFLSPSDSDRADRGLRINRPSSTDQQGAPVALNPPPIADGRPLSGSLSERDRRQSEYLPSNLKHGRTNEQLSRDGIVGMDPRGDGQAQSSNSGSGFQDGGLGVPERQPSSASYDSLFLPKRHLSPDVHNGSRSATPASQSYAFNSSMQAGYAEPRESAYGPPTG